MSCITQCDAIDGLAALDAGSVDLVLSDPPSGHTAAPLDVAPDLRALFAETWRVLKPTGVAVFMASSMRFATALIASQPKTFRYDLVWQKSIKTGFLNAKYQPLRSHEFALVFYRRRGTYNPQMEQGHVPIRKVTVGGALASTNYGAGFRRSGARVGATDRYPASVLTIGSLPNNSPLRVHHQQKPFALMSWLVRTYSNPGDLVVDPYAGSGSTGVAALAENRRFIGFDVAVYPSKSVTA